MDSDLDADDRRLLPAVWLELSLGQDESGDGIERESSKSQRLVACLFKSRLGLKRASAWLALSLSRSASRSAFLPWPT